MLLGKFLRWHRSKKNFDTFEWFAFQFNMHTVLQHNIDLFCYSTRLASFSEHEILVKLQKKIAQIWDGTRNSIAPFILVSLQIFRSWRFSSRPQSISKQFTEALRQTLKHCRHILRWRSLHVRNHSKSVHWFSRTLKTALNSAREMSQKK